MNRLSFSDARHLVSRTGFGAEWETIMRIERMTKNQAVDFIVSQKDYSVRPSPNFSLWRNTNMMRDRTRMKYIMRISKAESARLQEWWVNQMLTTKTPLLERMTLFWHNHFPSSIKKTRQASMLVNQNKLIRKHAMGNFGLLLRHISKDPAMLLYLDGHKNKKEAINENYAREVLELFTLAKGYDEKDVQEAARAFSGWTINKQGRFVFDRKQHDSGVKTFLGRRGRFTGDDIITILLKRPETAQLIADKFWNEFISLSRPNPRVTRGWAHQFRASNYNISVLLRVVLKSHVFWAKNNRGGLIKSPIELAVGTLRILPYSIPTPKLVHNLNIMGQGVFQHPSVKGWTGGKEWVSTQSTLRRTSLMTKLTRGNLNSRRYRSRVAIQMPNATREQLSAWLLPVDPINKPDVLPGKQRYVRSLVLDPAYQVC